MCPPHTQLPGKTTDLYVLFLPLFPAATTQSKEIRRRRATAAQGKEQTMAEQMITSESGKQQKCVVFARFFGGEGFHHVGCSFWMI